MFVRPCGVNIFKTLWFRDHMADVTETWHGLGTQLLRNGILIFGSRAVPGQPELSLVVNTNDEVNKQ